MPIYLYGSGAQLLAQVSQDFVDDVLLFDAGDDLHPGSPQQPQACFCTFAVLLVTDIPDANGNVFCESNPASLPSAVKGQLRSSSAFHPHVAG